ncbi:hypothetical protein ACTMU2_39260 [Cupriavidus basilensis]
MRNERFHSAAGNIHIPDLVESDGEIARRRLKRATFSGLYFKFSDARTLQFGKNLEFQEISLSLDAPLDLTQNMLRVITLAAEQTAVPLRVAVSSDEYDRTSNVGEYWLDNSIGPSASEISDFSFRDDFWTRRVQLH